MAREPSEGIRPPWSRSDRPVPRRLIRPLQSFLETETASGIVLLVALVAALAWANAPFRHTYEQAWGTHVAVGVGRWGIEEDLRGWIRDGLMALFFLVVGLEIKRELVTGELRSRRAAALPVLAAIGGMAVPAAVYLAVNPSGPASRGWGAAMPTDIALALGVLALALPRAPSGLRVFLLALAIVDDLGSIVIVAVFYSNGIALGSVALAAGLAVLIVLAQRINVRAAVFYWVLGTGMWIALHGSGVSPTLAGVAFGLLCPAVPFQRPHAVSREAHRIADETVDDPEPPDADATQWLQLARLTREAVSPLGRIEGALHPWTSYVVAPAFVLAVAGVSVSSDGLSSASGGRVALGLLLARLVGKPLGIFGASMLAVRVGAVRLPAGVSVRHVLGVAAAAGIPFSVSLFVAELGLPRPALLDGARIGVIGSALVAGAVGYLVLRWADRSNGLPAAGPVEPSEE